MNELLKYVKALDAETDPAKIRSVASDYLELLKTDLQSKTDEEITELKGKAIFIFNMMLAFPGINRIFKG